MIGYFRLGGILSTVVAVFGLGYHFGQQPYRAKYQALQAADWQVKAQGEAAAKTVLASQLAQAQRTSENNANVMQRLSDENTKTAQDRDITVARVHTLERLLAASAARSASASRELQEAGGRPVFAPASGNAGADEIGDLLVAARDESKRNADRLNSLIAEIQPQL